VDEQLLYEYTRLLSDKGFSVQTQLGFGKPGKAIPKIVNEGQFDLLIMGTHGHGNFKDLIFGTTVGNVRHAVSIPLFIIKN
jgi:manganese transport protein